MLDEGDAEESPARPEAGAFGWALNEVSANKKNADWISVGV